MQTQMFCVAKHPPNFQNLSQKLRSSALILKRKHVGFRTRAEPEGEGKQPPRHPLQRPWSGQDSTESLFAKELRRRGIPREPLNPTNKSFRKQGKPLEGVHEDDRVVSDGPPVVTEGQLERSRLLNSEGLEGLLPRVRELLTLGATSTFAFIPAIGIVVLFALTLYFMFGESFVHFGSPEITPPSYVEPYDLLGYPYTDQ